MQGGGGDQADRESYEVEAGEEEISEKRGRKEKGKQLTYKRWKALNRREGELIAGKGSSQVVALVVILEMYGGGQLKHQECSQSFF